MKAKPGLAAEEGMEAIFRALANISNDMIHVCSLEGLILFANQATERHLGYAIEELINTPSENLIHPDDLEKTEQDKQRLLKRGGPSPAREIRLIRKDGAHITVNRVAMLLGKAGKMTHYGVLLRNTTMLKTSARTLIATNKRLQQEIEERKLIEAKLINKKATLQEKAQTLEETNIALNVLLKKREDDRAAIEERVSANMGELISPYLKRLVQTRLDADQKAIVDTIQSNLRHITSGFMLKLSSKAFNLSPAELKVANLIRQGKRSKEIADFLSISVQTVKNHRHKIREKIGIKNKKVGLASYLSSLA